MKSILALCFSLAITCCAAKSAPSFSLESWMSDLSDVIGDKTLQDINIPGAHDAATSDITWQSKIAPGEDLPDKLNWLRYVGVGFAINKVSAGWARAQNLTIEELLQTGVRYLDLRLALKTDDLAESLEKRITKFFGLFANMTNSRDVPSRKSTRKRSEYYSVHGLYSTPLSQILKEIDSFLDQNPDEFLVLDLWKIRGGLTDDLYQQIVDALGEDRLFEEGDVNKTLNELWQTSKRVLITLGAEDRREQLDNKVFDHHALIDSYWPNASDQDEFDERMGAYFDSFNKRGLTVIQAQLTPSVKTVKNGLNPLSLNPSTLKSFWEDWKPEVMERLGDWHQITGGSIVQGDFVDEDFATAVIELNLGY